MSFGYITLLSSGATLRFLLLEVHKLCLGTSGVQQNERTAMLLPTGHKAGTRLCTCWSRLAGSTLHPQSPAAPSKCFASSGKLGSGGLPQIWTLTLSASPARHRPACSPACCGSEPVPLAECQQHCLSRFTSSQRRRRCEHCRRFGFPAFRRSVG